MSVALITSIYGDYDTLTDPPEQEGVDEYVAVVDREHDQVFRWKQIVEPRPHLHPRIAAKFAKCQPAFYTSCDVKIWVDGSTRLKHERVALWAADQLGPATVAQFAHPERDDLSAEAATSAPLRKYEGQQVVEQAAYYRSLGMPDHWGLWAAGFIVWGEHKAANDFGRRWLIEQLRWSYQDQISEPFLLWVTNTPIRTLTGNLWNNEHVRFDAHATEF